MKKILISLCNDTINFRYKIDKTKQEKDLTKTLMNTNVISNDELIFSDSYLKSNVNIMSSFLTEIVKEKKISKLVIEEFDIVPIVLDITNSIKNITKLYIIPDVPINYKVYEKLLGASYLKFVSCFEIPSFMLEKLCDNGIVVDLRCEIVSISNFVYQNNLVNYTKLYYRKTIKIFDRFNETDLNDFETFCQINRNLKTIYVYDYDISMIENIYKVLAKTNKRNVKIVIYQNLNNTVSINSTMKKLKMVNKLLIKDCNSKLRINYSTDYIRKNFIKQLSITNIKTCLLIVVLLELIVFVSVKLNNDKTNKNISDISDVAYAFENLEDDFVVAEEEASQDEPTTVYNTVYEESFDKLLAINSDTKAWLKVNNTNINYPVVQTTDNDFYLNHDFTRSNNSNGWIFIDYRNNLDELNRNTIIYGHNIINDLMFSTLRYTLNSSWYNNPDNLDITLNTPSKQLKARIFSVYVIEDTNDYLYVNFGDEDYTNFINTIKGRSIHDFGVDFGLEDKMITLSTCNGSGDKRLVVHAKVL